MTPEQLLALMQLLADLRTQLGQAFEENNRLHEENKQLRESRE